MGIGDIGALTGQNPDQSHGFKRCERLAQAGAADAKVGCQFALGR